MKKIVYFLLAGLAFASCNNNTDSDNNDVSATIIETDNPEIKEAKFEFNETVWDFGNIIDGEHVVHTFKFRNVGEGDLLISNCTASCGCTIPEWPKEPIPPGGEGSIRVEFNSTGKSGQVTKDITIISNATPVKTVLQIKTFVAKK